MSMDCKQLHCFLFVITLSILAGICDCSVIFTKEPSDVHATVGNSPILICDVQNLDWTNTMSWVKDGAIIARDVFENDKFETKLQDTSSGNLYYYTLTINNVLTTDEGDYRCEIHDTQGQFILRSKSAHLTVLQTPDDKYPECVSLNPYYRLGSGVILTCITEIVNPSVNLTWTKQGKPITNGISEYTESGLLYSQMEFIASKEDNLAIIICNQSSSLPNIKPVSCVIASLDIYYKPELSITHTNEIFAGSNSILFCQTFSNPPVEQYSWSFSSELDNTEYTDDGQVLRLINTSIKRDGLMITCSAENTIGSSSSATTLHVTSEIEGDYLESGDSRSWNERSVFSEDDGRSV